MSSGEWKCVRVIPAMQIVPGEHNISGYRQAAEALEVANYFVAQPVLSVDQTRRQSMAEKIIASAGKNPIAIQLGNSLTHDGRKWYRWRPRPQPNLKALPMQTWVDVITALVRRSLASGILFQGSPQERHLAEEIIALLPTDVREQVHTWSLGLSAIDMAVALSCCRLLVSVDTGPAHIAAALGIPVVVAFGPTPYRHYYPQGSSATAVVVGKAACSPCHGTKMAKTCRSNVCMSGIKSDRLITAVEQILQTTTPGLFIY